MSREQERSSECEHIWIGECVECGMVAAGVISALETEAALLRAKAGLADEIRRNMREAAMFGGYLMPRSDWKVRYDALTESVSETEEASSEANPKKRKGAGRPAEIIGKMGSTGFLVVGGDKSADWFGPNAAGEERRHPVSKEPANFDERMRHMIKQESILPAVRRRSDLSHRVRVALLNPDQEKAARLETAILALLDEGGIQ
jgi:hypothetical protein